jgi:hypothetical protein
LVELLAVYQLLYRRRVEKKKQDGGTKTTRILQSRKKENTRFKKDKSVRKSNEEYKFIENMICSEKVAMKKK